ncbi:MAG: hypothetical protein ACQJCO_02280 [cyanobacterium endosymbiont of Rhopalodia sterrenbergii]
MSDVIPRNLDDSVNLAMLTPHGTALHLFKLLHGNTNFLWRVFC